MKFDLRFWLLGGFCVLSSQISAQREIAGGGTMRQGRPVVAPPTPDILIVVLDDVGFLDAFNAYGSTTVRAGLPTLASCANRGRVFLNAYAAPTCAPSRRALHFGIEWTTNTGPSCAAPDPFTPLFAEKSIPERLPGYAAGLWGKWHLGGARARNASWEHAPALQGFDFEAAWTSANLNACGGNGYTHWQRVEGSHSFIETAYEPDVLRDSFVTNWPLGRSPKLAIARSSLAHVPFHWPGGGSPLDDPPAQFQAMLQRLDADLAAMLAVVNLQTTTVLIVGDNGTPPQVAPNPRRAKSSCYERGVRVPMLAVGAGVQPGICSELVWIGDLYATAIALGGGTLGTGPYPISSQSLAPLLSGASWAPRDHVIGGDLWAIPGTEGTRYIVTSSGWKLIQWDTDGDDDADREELYQLSTDPDETTDVLVPFATLAASLRATLEAEALP